MGFSNSDEDPENLVNSELMKKNIAEMYQYYNHLIFQQGGSMMQQQNIISSGTYNTGPTPRLGDPDHFEKSSYNQSYHRASVNQDLGVIGFRPQSTSMRDPRSRPVVSVGRNSQNSSADEDRASRSRSRSATKSTENLLVSLNESCPPIANASAVNLSVERSMSVQNYAGKPSLLAGLKLTPSKSMTDNDDLLSVAATNPRARLQSQGKGQHEKIKVRYSTK